MAHRLDSIRNKLAHHAKSGWQWVDTKLRPFPQHLGPVFTQHYEAINKSQWWDTQKLAEYQNEQLAALIEHSYSNVPYYTKVMDERGLKPKDIQTPKDLA